MELVRDYLMSRGVDKRGIFFLNKELLEWDSVRTYSDAWETIQTWFAGYSGPRYVCIDEVQEISEWERLAASMLAEGYADVLVTGSNANVLSSELSTLIAGRYVELKVYPLSFGEWLRFRQASMDQSGLDIPEEFRKYLRYGGLPGIHSVTRNILNGSSVFSLITVETLPRQNDFPTISVQRVHRSVWTK